MTEEQTAYTVDSSNAPAFDVLFGMVSENFDDALAFYKAFDRGDYTKQVWPFDDGDSDWLFIPSVFTIANAMMRAKGYDNPQDEWRKWGFVQWVDEKLRASECKTIDDVLAQYEEGGEPAYIRD